MSHCVRVCVDESLADEAVEFSTEDDGTILVSALRSQFEGATGLKYRNPSSGNWRAVRAAQELVFPPADGWGDQLYMVVRASANPAVSTLDEVGSANDGNKRKINETAEDRAAKNPRHTLSPASQDSNPDIDDTPQHDLIVLGLAYKVDQDELKKYFEQFGEVENIEVKKDSHTGQSRGFGFVRFKNYKVQHEVANVQHVIGGRQCEIKRSRQSEHPTKLFVGHLPFFTSRENFVKELWAHFQLFGSVADLHIPTNYRGFGFVTYKEGDDARRAINSNQFFQGRSLNLTVASPKKTEFDENGPQPPPQAEQDHHHQYGEFSSHHHQHRQQDYHPAHGYDAARYDLYGQPTPPPPRQLAEAHPYRDNTYASSQRQQQQQQQQQMYVVSGASKESAMLMTPQLGGGYSLKPGH